MKAHLFSDVDSLREAVGQLEAYVSQVQQGGLTSLVSKTVGLVKSLFVSPHEGEEPSRQAADTQDVSKAVEVILRQRFYIEKLQGGTPEERALADSFTRAILAYNKTLEKRVDNKIHRTGIENFFSMKSETTSLPPRVPLSQNITVKKYYPETPRTEVEGLFLEEDFSNSLTLPQQIIELVRMKSVSLLERSGVLNATEARLHVNKTPIISRKDGQKCRLKQTLHIFPGEVIIVRGEGTLHPESKSVLRLLPETFHLSIESTQTGFPHPSQRAGWSLAPELVPLSPQRTDLLKVTEKLFKNRDTVASQLLTGKAILTKAKQLLQKKQDYFDSHKEEMLSLHRRLISAIFKAASPEEEVPAIVNQFYEVAATQPSPYEWLSEAHEELKALFITKPYEALKKAILGGKSTNFTHPIASVRYTQAKAVLDDTLNLKTTVQDDKVVQAVAHILPQHSTEQVKSHYINTLGAVLGEAAKSLILQYLSEDLIFPPPQLTLFERKLQASLYTHVGDFFEELYGPEQEVDHLMHHQMLADIALFEENVPLTIPEELANYFSLRYSSLTFFNDHVPT